MVFQICIQAIIEGHVVLHRLTLLAKVLLHGVLRTLGSQRIFFAQISKALSAFNVANPTTLTSVWISAEIIGGVRTL
jgi:hypothetical protein